MISREKWVRSRTSRALSHIPTPHLLATSPSNRPPITTSRPPLPISHLTTHPISPPHIFSVISSLVIFSLTLILSYLRVGLMLLICCHWLCCVLSVIIIGDLLGEGRCVYFRFSRVILCWLGVLCGWCWFIGLYVVLFMLGVVIMWLFGLCWILSLLCSVFRVVLSLSHGYFYI